MEKKEEITDMKFLEIINKSIDNKLDKIIEIKKEIQNEKNKNINIIKELNSKKVALDLQIIEITTLFDSLKINQKMDNIRDNFINSKLKELNKNKEIFYNFIEEHINSVEKTINNITSKNKYIKLNVGGMIFETTYQTLTQNSDYFKLLLSDKYVNNICRDEDGIIFIDIDPRLFEIILNRMRNSDIPLNNFEKTIMNKKEEYSTFHHLIDYLLVRHLFEATEFIMSKNINIFWPTSKIVKTGRIIGITPEKIIVMYKENDKDEIFEYHIILLKSKYFNSSKEYPYTHYHEKLNDLIDHDDIDLYISDSLSSGSSSLEDVSTLESDGNSTEELNE